MEDVQPLSVQAPKARRYHSPGFRAEVIKAVKQPGTSLAAVARSFDLSPNLVRRWVRKSDDGQRRSAHASAARLAAIRSQLVGQGTAASANSLTGSKATPGFIPFALMSLRVEF
jgi:transposase-like protein